MKGSKCRCGFATLSDRRLCPRCEKRMKPDEWPDEGKVLSFIRLQATPEGFQEPQNMALVQIEDGPKVVCWTSGSLKEDDEVSLSEVEGRYICAPKAKSKTDGAEGSQSD